MSYNLRSFEMLYDEALQFLYGLTNYERTAPNDVDSALKLERMRLLLAELGNPQDRYRVIHVAGTKGKGSTCAMLESCLRHFGLRTGMYISPHLSTFRERMRVNGQLINVDQVLELTDLVRKAMEKVPGITTFEAITAMALLHFARQNVQWAVIEVGLGGRLDATNVLMPQASIITSISYDHMQWLGDTLALIAREKAGIIKPGVPVISHSQTIEAAMVIEQVAHERNAPLTMIGRHWRWEPSTYSLGVQSFDIKQPARIRSREKPFVSDLEGHYEIALLGKHQIENASTVIATFDVLRDVLKADGATYFGSKALHEGLRAAQWPGRFEVLRIDPPLIIDGAHNVDSVNKLAITLGEYFPGKRWTFIFGGYRDKQIEGMLKVLHSRAQRWIFTRVRDNPRAMMAEELREIGMRLNLRNVSTAASMSEALDLIHDGNEAVCVCGSIALTGEARVRWAVKSGRPVPPSDAGNLS
ncbi:MAG: bifunctional folylpolyglutamate synthase/dihydrofolate synthase [Chloroflexi bacterium]|nr:bifunctional folylpolyglutamate synthase/dihydrofolate synthase [Chloroflexota bacterium]